ncbi:MAG: hypothetical protein HKL95_06370 [Phycisphaerae bacterium]|nr:hypothetical protein [Phycisphaerae bacterium]
MILALGLVMVAASFPVAIKWTRQDTNKTIGRLIATNALGIIETEYTPASFSGVTSSTPVPLPTLPSLIDRTYAFGTPTPYPDVQFQSGYPANNGNSLYFWTALACVAPSQAPIVTSPALPQPTYDLYVLVFKKGNYKDQWTVKQNSGGPWATLAGDWLLGSGGTAGTSASGGTVGGVNATGGLGSSPAASGDGNANYNATGSPAAYVYGVPVVAIVAAGALNTDADFPIGSLGIDETTGAVFRKTVVNIGGTNYAWRSDLPIPTSTPSYTSGSGPQSDPVAYVPPADGQTASPLIYIYTTTFTP